MAGYRLYGAPGKASAAPEAVLEEIGIPYEYVLTEPSEAGPEYARLNPLRRVPTLVSGDLVIWEAAAICVFLADRHPEAQLLGPANSRARATAHQWLHFLSSSLQTTYMLAFYPHRFCDDARGASRVRELACQQLATSWSVIGNALDGRTNLVNDRLSICDLYVTMLAAWHFELEEELGVAVPWTDIGSLLRSVVRRPGTGRMLERNVDPAIHQRLADGG
jgi:glutathione S-transferase